MIAFLGAAVLLGLSAGFSPGPLLSLVIAQTMRHGIREGVKVALAPLMTDLPIIALSVFLLSRLAAHHAVLGWVSIAGGLFVIYLAWDTFRSTTFPSDPTVVKARSIGRGVAVNALSPHPYLFWLTVGGPIIVRTAEENLAAAGAFIVGFLLSLVGSKICVAVAVARARQVLAGKVYGIIMRVLGISLFVFAVILIRDGLKLLRVIS